jgi:hypothetical protein
MGVTRSAIKVSLTSGGDVETRKLAVLQDIRWAELEQQVERIRWRTFCSFAALNDFVDFAAALVVRRPERF